MACAQWVVKVITSAIDFCALKKAALQAAFFGLDLHQATKTFVSLSLGHVTSTCPR